MIHPHMTRVTLVINTCVTLLIHIRVISHISLMHICHMRTSGVKVMPRTSRHISVHDPKRQPGGWGVGGGREGGRCGKTHVKILPQYQLSENSRCCCYSTALVGDFFKSQLCIHGVLQCVAVCCIVLQCMYTRELQ